MIRAPKYGDAFECTDTKAVFSVVSVKVSHECRPADDFDIHWHIVMVCVVGPDPTVRLAGGGPTLGDTHNVVGSWASLQDGYTLLTT